MSHPDDLCPACRTHQHEHCDPVTSWCQCDTGLCGARLRIPEE